MPKFFYQINYWNVPEKLDSDTARQELKHLNRLQVDLLAKSFIKLFRTNHFLHFLDGSFSFIVSDCYY